MTNMVSEILRAFAPDFTKPRCNVCHKFTEECVCPVCVICGEKGLYSCYVSTSEERYHALTSHRVAVAQREYLVECAQAQLALELEALEDIKKDPEIVFPYMKRMPTGEKTSD